MDGKYRELAKLAPFGIFPLSVSVCFALFCFVLLLLAPLKFIAEHK